MSASAWVRTEENTYGYARAPFGLCEHEGCNGAACYRVPSEEAANDNGKLVCLRHKPADILFTPFLGQQEKLWLATERWVLGGGGAGGAKTFLGSWLWLKLYHHERERFESGEIVRSKARFLFLRRTVPEVMQVINDFKCVFRLIDPNATWDGEYNIATFPSAGGMEVRFGGCKDKDDWQKYWGHEYTIIVLDEATQFTLEQIEQLDARLRTADPVLGQMLQMYLLTNPLGSNTKKWMKRRFVNIAPPEVPVQVKTKLTDGREIVDWQVYIPCNVLDNAALMEDGKYEANLRRKRPAKVRALLNNDWDVDEGSWLDEDWNREDHVCKPFAIPASWTKSKSMDYGFRGRTSVLWWAIGPQGEEVCYRSFSSTGMTVSEVAQRIKEIEQAPLYAKGANGKTVKVCDKEWDEIADCSTVMGPADKSLWSKIGEGSESRGEILERIGCGFYRGRADPTSRADASDLIRMRLRHRVADPFDDKKTVAAVRFFDTCETRFIADDGTPDLTGPIHTIPVCPFDEDNPDVWDTDADDHDIDAWAYFVLSRPMPGEMTDEGGEVIEIMQYRGNPEGKAAAYDW